MNKKESHTIAVPFRSEISDRFLLFEDDSLHPNSAINIEDLYKHCINGSKMYLPNGIA